MTPKEASIEIQLIRQQLQRLVRINGIAPADYTTIQDACVNIGESLNSLSSFIAPLRTKSKPRHPPKVPSVPERQPVDPIMNTGSLPPETLRGIRDMINSYKPLPHIEIIKERKIISGGARPLGKLE